MPFMNSVIQWYLDENGNLCLVPVAGYTFSYNTFSAESSYWTPYTGPITLPNSNVNYYFKAVPASGNTEYKTVEAYLNNNDHAIFNYYGTITLGDAIFSGNCGSDGGAICNTGTITLSDAVFSGNWAYNYNGGAIRNGDGGTITLASGTFSDNSADNGGAIGNRDSGTITLASGTFSGNSADNGGAIYNSGTITLGDVAFSGNIADNGGAIYNRGIVVLTGQVQLETETDTLVNRGILIWNLTEADEKSVTVSDYSLLSNSGTLSVSVTSEQPFKEYVLAKNAGGNLAGKNTFSVIIDGTDTLKLTANEECAEYGGVVYALARRNGELIFSVARDHIAIMTDSRTKKFDGTPLTADGYTYTGKLAEGDQLEVTVSGSMTDPGIGYNYVSCKVLRGEQDVTSEYYITTEMGALVVEGALTWLLNDDGKLCVTVPEGYTGLAFNRIKPDYPGRWTVYTDPLDLTEDGAFYFRTTSPTGLMEKRTIQVYTGHTENRAYEHFDDPICLSDYLFWKNSAGALSNSGSMAFFSVMFSGNNATGSNYGGAIYNSGTITLGDATFSGNSARYGGAIYNTGTITLNDAVFSGNNATNNYGGAICNSGTITLNDAVFSGNSASYSGGAICNSGTITLGDATFSGNSACYGGAIDNTGTITLGDATFSGNRAGSGGAIYNAGTITLGDATFSGNNSRRSGGAIDNTGTITLGDATFSGNSAGSGGAIYNTGTITLGDATFSGNNASGYGSAIYNSGMITLGEATFSGNTASTGGAIYNDAGGTVSLSGRITLETETDTIVNNGVLNWDLTHAVIGKTAETATLNDYSLLENNGTLVISITSQQLPGEYILAENVSDLTGKKTFSVSMEGTHAGNVTAGQGALEYEGIYFELYQENSNLVFSVFREDLIWLSADSAEKTYDGTALTAGYTYAGILKGNDQLNVTVEGSQTDAGIGINRVTGYTVTRNGEDVTSEYTFADPVDGVLTVNKREVTLTSADDAKFYDGTALTNHTVTVSGDGFASGEGATYNVTGFQTEPGSSKNTFTYTLNNGTKTENYIINTEEGTLMVTKKTALTITARSYEKEYDGITLTADGYDSVGTLAEGDRLVVTVGGSILDKGTAASTVETVQVLNASGEDVTKNYAITKNNGTLEVKARTAVLTITADSAEKLYDGTALTEDGYTMTGGTLVSGETLSVTTTGTITDAGTTANTAEYKVLRGETDVTGNYMFAPVVSGTLTVNKRNVTLTSADDAKVYDGTPLTNHTVTVSGDGFASGEGATYNVTGSQTEVGSSANTFTYTLNNGTKAGNYVISTKEGTLTVTDKTVLTITAKSYAKEYDGITLTADGYDSVGTLAEGDRLVVAVGGSILDKGTAASTVETVKVLNASGEDVTDNYAIVKQNGTLEVKARSEQITITTSSAEKQYDGTALTKDGYTLGGGTVLSGETLSITVTGTLTDAGTSANTAEYKVLRGTTDVTSNYTFAPVVSGTLTVNKRNVTLTSADDAKVYDGTPLTNHTVTVSGDGFASGEGATYNVTGSQTEVGSSANTFTYTLNEGTKAGNYIISTEEGTLTVTDKTVLTITAKSYAKEYDGITLTADGYDSEGTLAEGDHLVVTVGGSILDKGTAASTVESVQVLDASGADVTKNYAITKNSGTLEVKARTEVLTITADSAEKTYDGTALTEDGYTLTGGTLVSGETLSVTTTGTITDAGTTANTAEYKVLRGETDVTGNYTFAPVVNGTLTVNQRSVTLTSVDDAKVYDGTPLTNHTVTVSGDGFASGEGATYTVTGSQTEIGASANTFTYALNNGTKAGNYVISTEEGTLTVNSDYTNITLNNRTMTVTETIDNESITFVNNGVLNAEGASVHTKLLKVTGTGNSILGDDVSADTFTTDSGSELAMGREVFDSLMKTKKMTRDVQGTLILEEAGNQDDLKVEAPQIVFRSGLQGIQKAELKGSRVYTFEEGKGTARNDTITIANGAEITFGTHEGTFDMLAGTNAIAVKKGANATFLGTVNNLSKLTADAGTNEKSMTKIHADELLFSEKGGSLSLGKYVSLTAGTIAGGDKADKISIGANNTVEVASLLLGLGANTITVGSGSTLTVGELSGEIQKLTLSNGSSDVYRTVLDIGDITGTAKADALSFGNYTNVTMGDWNSAGGSDKLSLGKDSIMKAGSLTLTDSSSITLGAYAETKIDSISGINRLTVTAGKVGDLTVTDIYGDVTGTAKADTLVLGNYTTTKIDGNVFLYDGNDKVSLGKGAAFTAGVLNLGSGNNTVAFGDNATVQLAGKLLAEGGGDKVSVGKYTTFTAQALDLGSGNNTVTFGDYATVEIAGELLAENGNDKVSVGKGTKFTVASMDLGFGNNTVIFGDYATVEIAGDLLAEGGGDKVSVGKYAEFTAEALDLGSGNNTVTFGDYATVAIAGDLLAENGNDKVSVGKGTKFTAASMDLGSGNNMVSFGAYSEVHTGTINGVNKLTVTAGKADDQTVADIAGDITGTAKADTFSFGNYTDVNIHGTVSFEGKDKVSVGKGSTLVLKSADATGLKSLSIGKGSVAYLSTELCGLVAKGKGFTVHDIGSAADGVAQAFTDIGSEQHDNEIARTISGSYNGWLDDELDTVDLVTIGSQTSLTAVDSNDLTVSCGSEVLSFSEGCIDLTGYAGSTLKIELASGTDKSVLYQIA